MDASNSASRLARKTCVDEWAIGVAPISVEDWIAHALEHAAVPRVAIRWFEWPGRGRFVADPIAFAAGGDHFVAYELFDPWRGRGSVGVGVVRDGAINHLAIALDDPNLHLAYPFVFERSGELYCVPDASRSDGVAAYRITTPTSWEYVAMLPGVPKVSDPTIFEHRGRWWLLGTTAVAERETFRVFYAPDPFVKWTECFQGGVPSDRARRSAGPIVQVGDRLVRPSQDCATHYGAGIWLNMVDELSDRGCSERQMVRLAPPGEWPYTRGMHTVSGTGGCTVIDASRRKPTLAAAPLKVSARVARRRRLSRAPWTTA